MSKARRNTTDFVFGFILAAILFGVPYVMENGLFPRKPYSNVVLRNYEIVGNILKADFEFIKTEHCVFNKMGVFGVALGYQQSLDFTFPEGERGDRWKGPNSFLIDIGLSKDKYEKVEIRTRHICNGKKRDTIFYTFEEELT